MKWDSQEANKESSIRDRASFCQSCVLWVSPAGNGPRAHYLYLKPECAQGKGLKKPVGTYIALWAVILRGCFKFRRNQLVKKPNARSASCYQGRATERQRVIFTHLSCLVVRSEDVLKTLSPNSENRRYSSSLKKKQDVRTVIMVITSDGIEEASSTMCL